MPQSASTDAILRDLAPKASPCGDVLGLTLIKIADSYSCENPDSYEIQATTAVAVAGGTVSLQVSATPVGAPIPSTTLPFRLYAETVLTFGSVELVVIEDANLNSTTPVAVRIKPATAAVAVSSTTNLYRYHTLRGVAGADMSGSAEKEDVTKNGLTSQKDERITVRGLSFSLSSFINSSDAGLFRSVMKLTRNDGSPALTSAYGLPGVFDVGPCHFANDVITRQPKAVSKLTVECMFQAPFARFLRLQDTTDAAQLAYLVEQIKLWGYSQSQFT